MAKVKTIKVDLYRVTLIVFVGTAEELKYWCRESDDKSIRKLPDAIDDATDYEAGTYWNNGIAIIHLPKLSYKKQYLVDVAHEIGHVVLDFLAYVDIQFDASNDEAFAYLLGYLVGEVFDKADYEEYTTKDVKKKA